MVVQVEVPSENDGHVGRELERLEAVKGPRGVVARVTVVDIDEKEGGVRGLVDLNDHKVRVAADIRTDGEEKVSTVSSLVGHDSEVFGHRLNGDIGLPTPIPRRHFTFEVIGIKPGFLEDEDVGRVECEVEERVGGDVAAGNVQLDNVDRSGR